MNEDSLTWLQITPNINNIEKVTEFIESGLSSNGVSMKIITKFDIAIDELFSNVVYYSGATIVNIGYGIESEKAVLAIKDNGVQYNPLENEEPDITLKAEERSIGGLGICIVKKIMDDMIYERYNGQNILIIKKSLKL